MSRVDRVSRVGLRAIALSLCLMGIATIAAADAGRFVGDYAGSADILMADGTSKHRDMSVSISETEKGFSVRWTSITYRVDGTSKEKTYDIDFVPSDREHVYAAAMKKNVFGHEVQLDPMKGEPYVWARIYEDTMTVYSLFVDTDGGYELQQFDRTLVPGGLNLDFQRVSDGVVSSTVETLLTRQ
ncbi:MAG: hypothetical protein JJ992_29965 [Planctomycetes bacterium]|nr:hypothetical protein [Planctomycetota bacterium]